MRMLPPQVSQTRTTERWSLVLLYGSQLGIVPLSLS